MRYLVTGGAGFIGSHLIEALVARGEQVRVLDDFSTGRLENLTAVRGQVEIVTRDVRVPTDLARTMVGVDCVVHLAARLSVAESVEHPRRYHESNVDGILNMLLATRDAGVRRFVFASSAGVYGSNPTLPSAEDQPVAPVSPYTFSKLIGEQYCRLFSQLYGPQTVSLRFFNVFGPRQRADSSYAGVITRFCSRLSAGASPVILGDGLQSRDFVYVGDVVRATLAAADPAPGNGEIFNVGTGRPCTIRNLAGTLGQLFGVHVEPILAPPQPGDVRQSLASTERADAILGFRASTSLVDGLAATVAWYRAHANLLAGVA